MIDNMTDGQQLALFILVGASLAAGLADYVTTAIGLGKGFKEINPINKFLFAKIGQPLTAFIELALMIFTPMLLSTFSPVAGFVSAIGFLALESFNAIRNYRLIKK
jgi:hypothetical protein